MMTWLTMAIRLVGLLGILLNADLLTSLFSNVTSVVVNLVAGRSALGPGAFISGRELIVMVVGHSVIGLGVICFSLWLMFKPHKLAARWVRASAGKCPLCLYPRAADATGPCSECGL